MARGTSLGELVNQLRIATRRDTDPARSLNVVEHMKQMLRDEQERLYDEFDWPFLKVSRSKSLEAGQRYYDVPDDINLERVQKVDVKYGARWLPVERGISLDHFNTMDSDLDVRHDPAQCWDVSDTGAGEQVEVWPVPATNGSELRFRGIRRLPPLLANDDIAVLDDQVIVGFTAAQILSAEGKGDLVTMILTKARRRLQMLQGRVMKTRRNLILMGGEDPCADTRDRRGPLVAVVRGS